ncbi:putative ABC transport system permease protein [Desulfacinum hydrothermale DSM 13146]|uniref:Putative ABC transport system permease protein n=1 Tax=Desulfacinum hydrothermale DSM 13146 TaxID=1121390 RepID=A0A1W1XD90_9BACT|nr:iron export ABC transporter permease subunit FetB [Desulfacinum hydrothermale]SMC21863.1 putative ABC transport system permease protein [Desulfacinum hydrothermale DSM 13146]
MDPGLLKISNLQLAAALGFVLLGGLTSLVHGLRLEKDLLWGTVRTFAQLFAMGYVLTVIFRVQHPEPVLAFFVFMIASAAWIIRSRVSERAVSFFLPTLCSMLVSYLIIAYVVTAVVVGVDPWWRPQYFLPLGGMVIGNSMNAVAIALERLFGELRSRRAQVEALLCLGADCREASGDMVRMAVKAGMIPSINAMMGVGIVFIPGMMTGQILAGADPLVAIRYQIVVMLMLVGSTTLATLLVVWLVRRRCFGPKHELLL